MDSPLPQKYLQIQIQDNLKHDIRIENAELERYSFLPVLETCFWDLYSGSFYNEDDPSDILKPDYIDDMVIRHNGGMRTVCSMDSSRGHLDLVDDIRDAKICSLAWRAPTQFREPNEIKKLDQDERYVVEIGSWNETVTTGRVPVTIKEHDQGTWLIIIGVGLLFSFLVVELCCHPQFGAEVPYCEAKIAVEQCA